MILRRILTIANLYIYCIWSDHKENLFLNLIQSGTCITKMYVIHFLILIFWFSKSTAVQTWTCLAHDLLGFEQNYQSPIMSHVHEDEMYRRSEAEKDAIHKFHNSHPTDAHTGSHQAELDKNLVHGMSWQLFRFMKTCCVTSFLRHFSFSSLYRKLVENSILLYVSLIFFR